MLINKPIPGFYNGISQQPPGLRQDTQMEDMENWLPGIAEGLVRRPPTEFVANLDITAPNAKPLIHTINRDITERYIVVASGDAEDPLDVYDLDGNKMTMRYGRLASDLTFTEDAAVKAYLANANPRDVLSMCTIADYTIVANSAVQCAMSGSPTTLQRPKGIIHVARAVNACDYRVFVDGVIKASYTTPETGERTTTIAADLYLDLVANLSGTAFLTFGAPVEPDENESGNYFEVIIEGTTVCNVPYVFNDIGGGELQFALDPTMNNLLAELKEHLNQNIWLAERIGDDVRLRKLGSSTFTYTINGHNKSTITAPSGTNPWSVSFVGGKNTIFIERNDDVDFQLSVSDSWDNQALLTTKGKAQKMSDLPPVAPEGFVIEVVGEDGKQAGNYFLQYGSDTGATNGVWKETFKPGLDNAYDEDTMPHRLVRTATGEFTFAPIIWEDRKVGDENTACVPSFVNGYITDVFMFRNRLGFLSGENCVLSKSGDFFNFFPGTVMDILDDDPIDLATSSEQVSILRHAVAFDKNLLLFSDQTQFILGSGENPLTPKTVNCTITTRFETIPGCKPVGSGANVYFVQPRGHYSAIREYFVSPQSLVNDAADVTAHCPYLIPDQVYNLTASAGLEMLMALSDDTPGMLFVYNSLWQGDQKVQSAWHKWTFDGTVLYAETLDNQLFLILRRGSEYSLEQMFLDERSSGDLNFRIHLDRVCSVTGVYDSNAKTTTWTLPYDVVVETSLAVVKSDSGSEVLPTSRPSASTVSAAGNHSSVACYIGYWITSKVQLSECRMDAPNTTVDVLQGRLQVRNLKLSYRDTNQFRVEVTPRGRSTMTTEYSGVVTGLATIGEPYLDTVVRSFPIFANARGTKVEIITGSYMPVAFSHGSWEASFTSRSRSV